MQISTFDVLIKTLFTYANVIDLERKKLAMMILEAVERFGIKEEFTQP
jgi:hypothetical protein